MFGLCVFNKYINQYVLCLGIFLFGIFFSAHSFAQSKGQVSVEEATVFAQADFDAPVLQVLPYGGVFDISPNTKNNFYRIRLKDGTLGYIAEAEIHQLTPSELRAYQKHLEESKKTAAETPKKKKRSKPFENIRYRGLVFENQNYTEDTLSGKQKSNMMFYGLQFTGHDTLFEGEIYTDTLILFHSGAPSWYQVATNNQASGFILNTHFLFLNVFPQSEDGMGFWGFGPMAKLTHYDVTVSKSAPAKSYTMDEVDLGVVFNIGVGLRISQASVRLDAKYYWERNQYYSLGLATLMAF